MTHLYSVHEPAVLVTTVALRVTLLGGFSVEHDGARVPESSWQRRSARQLTKLLATDPGHALHREQVIDLLWPDADPDSARNSLAKALHAARRVLEPERAARAGASVLRTRHEMILLDTASVQVDVEEFQQRAWAALRQPTVGGLEHAISAYGGTLLPEDLYEDWTAEQRQHLTDLHQRLLHALAELLEGEGSHLQAVECLQRALQIDPTHEEAHRRLMRIYGALGDVGAATRQYALCRTALERELAVTPSSETVALLEEVSARDRSAVTPALRDRATPFIGRVDEQRRLAGLVARAERGSGGLVVVTGEAGVGKTRLVREVAREAAARGALVVAGPASGTLALAPFTAALEAHAHDTAPDARAHLARRYPTLSWCTPSFAPVIPPVALGHESGRELQLAAEIARLLHELGHERTVVVLLGDLDTEHGTNPALLATLTALARDRRWLLVGTTCDESIRPGSDLARMLAALSYAQASVRLPLELLGPAEIAQLVGTLDPEARLGEDERRRICTLAGGNPRFAEEFVRERLDRHGAHKRWNAPDTGPPPVPALVRALLQRTLARLGSPVRRLLELIASADGDVTFDEVRRAATAIGLAGSDAELFESLDLALAASVVVEHDDGYRIRHAVMTTALLDDLPRHRRTALRAALRDSVLDLRLAADMAPAASPSEPQGGAPWCS